MRTACLGNPCLLNNIHDTMVRIMGVSALTTPLWSIQTCGQLAPPISGNASSSGHGELAPRYNQYLLFGGAGVHPSKLE